MQYHNITKDDMLNGDGLRVVLWVAGCGHACPGCHNPITWDENGGLPFDEAAKEEIFTELAKDYVSGVTFSGGDPLYPANREQIADLPFLDTIDVIVDGPFIESQKNTQLCWRGSANQRVIDVRRTRETGTVCLHENTDK